LIVKMADLREFCVAVRCAILEFSMAEARQYRQCIVMMQLYGRVPGKVTLDLVCGGVNRMSNFSPGQPARWPPLAHNDEAPRSPGEQPRWSPN
jgi:hypothetical protein